MLTPEHEHRINVYRYCLSSPPLAQLPNMLTADDLKEINAVLPDYPHHLPEYNGRLGIWYEHLWLAIVDSHPNWQLIASNYPIQEGKKTQGAIDLLIADHQKQQIIHLELAVKFYMQFYQSGWQGWFGPNPTDQFSKKLAWMLTHQLPIGFHPTIQKLRLQFPHYQFVQRMLMQGRLFTAGLRCTDGVWLRDSQLQGIIRGRYLQVTKNNWLTPQELAYQPLPEHINSVVMVYGQGQQMMLVPDHWPMLIEAQDHPQVNIHT
ncbi:DUF1853 family protein [Celerinatantimonas yamalensis]|uniref:DUF1853 family protein n=1 Tax=Celerinatantimonas yamalensis TaxID=559956 RepID=A0ABW9G363_9GAMM